MWRQYKPYELRDSDSTNVFDPDAEAVIESFDAVGFSTRLLGTWKHRARGAFLAKVDTPMPDAISEEMPPL